MIPQNKIFYKIHIHMEHFSKKIVYFVNETIKLQLP